jgi:uncharacterized protein (TIGR02266 family)
MAKNGGSKDGANRRRHPRADLSLLIQYRFNTMEEFLSEYATNISIGGMFIKTPEPRTQGTLIYFQFTLKDGSKLIEGLGRVTWAKHGVAGKVVEDIGMGIEFVNVDEESMALIEQIVKQNLSKPRG